MFNRMPRQLKTILIGIGVTMLVGLVILLVFFFSEPPADNPENPLGDTIFVEDLSRALPELDRSQINFINTSIFAVAQLNYPTVISGTRAVVREGTSIYEFRQATRIHTINFIVDIESIGQSYNVYFDWSTEADNQFVSPYGVVVTCLPPEQLIFGEFECTDFMYKETGGQDPAMLYLPYSQDNWRVFASLNDNGTLRSIVVFVRLDNFDYNQGVQESLFAHENAALDYLRQRIDITKYKIEFQNSDNLPPQH